MHTPGPWEFVIGDSYGSQDAIIRSVRDDPRDVQVVMRAETHPSWIEDPEFLADCKLMAAAPELMEACKAAMDWIDKFGEHAPIQFGGEAELYQQLRAALAKAKGKV